MIIAEPIHGNGLTLRPRFAAVSLEVTTIDMDNGGLLLAEYRPWELCTVARNEVELRKQVESDICFLWQEYALAPDADLSLPAQRVKQRLLRDFEYEQNS